MLECEYIIRVLYRPAGNKMMFDGSQLGSRRTGHTDVQLVVKLTGVARHNLSTELLSQLDSTGSLARCRGSEYEI